MSKNTGTSELINYFDLGANGDVGIAGSLDINTIANATTDTDTFLVSDTGIIKYRTGAQLLSDIGAAPAVAGGYVPYTGAGANVDLGIYNLTANAVTVNGSGSNSGIVHLESNAIHSLVNGYGSIASGTTNQFNLYQTTGAGVFRGAILSLNSITASATRTFTLPDADGTIALTSSLSGYLPLTGGTLTGALNGTSATFSGDLIAASATLNTPAAGISMLLTGRSSDSLNQIRFNSNVGALNNFITSLPASLIIASQGSTPIEFITNNAVSSTPRMSISGAGTVTLTGALNGTTASFAVSVGNSNTGLDLTNNGALGYGNSINFYQNATKVAQIFCESSAANTSEILFKTTVASTLATRLIINSAGNVGIGTASPSSILNIVDTSANDTTLTIGVAGEVPVIKAGGANTDLQIEAVGSGGYLNFVTNSNPRIRIMGGGNVLIGTTTDNGYKLRVNGGTQASSFNTDSGTTLMATYSTFTTFYTVSNYQNAIYLVTLQLNGYSNYTAYATICQNDSGLVIMNQVNNVAYIQVSGLNIQGSQNSGASQNMVWKIIKIS